MINYLEWLAQYVIEWPEHYTHGFVITENGIPQYVRFNYGQGFSKAEWRAARDDLESPYSGNPERFKANGRLQIKKWGVAEDDFLAPEVGVVESFLGNPFSSPEEDEEWEKIERRMDTIGQNGNGAEHYDAPVLSKYHVLINGKLADFYDIIVAYGITNPADQHAVKKMLRPGKRGSKDGIQDRREAIASLQRAIELEGGL